MARITAPTGSTIDLTQLEDHEPYKGVLKAIDWTTGSAEYGAEQRLTLDWDLGDDTDIRDWISLRLGKLKTGGVSKLRQLLNALSGKPADTEVSFFDTETLEWGYEGADGPAHNQLIVGMEVVFRGLKGKREDGTDKFSITVYQAPKRRPVAETADAKPNHAAAAAKKIASARVADDEIPF